MKKHTTLPALLLLLALVAGLMAAPAAARVEVTLQTEDTLALEVGDMEMSYDFHNGMTLRVHDIEMIRGSSLWVMTPGWTERIFGMEENPDLLSGAEIEATEDGGLRVMLERRPPESHDETPAFAGTEVYTLHPDNTIEWDLKFRLLEDIPAIIEWNVASLNPTPLLSAPYEGTVEDGEVEGVIPAESPGAAVDVSTVANDIRTLRIDSRIGPMEIEVNDEPDMILFDYRKNRWARADKPLFWFGQLGREIESGKEYHYSVKLSFPEEMKTVATAAAPVEAAAGAEETDAARLPNTGERPLIPKPKDAAFTGERFPLSGKTRVYTGKNVPEGYAKAGRFFLKDLEDLYGTKASLREKDAPAEASRPAIVLGGPESRAAEFCAEAGLELPEHEQGYVLRVGADGAAVAGNSPEGVFYGATTLAQLIGVDGEGVYLRGAEISDYPSLDFRGIHALSGKGAGDEISKAVRTLMARFKINSFVWETEYLIWDSAPEIAHPQYGMKKSEARKVVDAADENMIEIIPLVQSLGHSEWIFVNDQNLDIAEDPDTPYAYNPTNPRTYEFIFSVYQEAVDFFQPERFHIGHDEVAMRGRFPYRSKESGLSATELILGDIHKLHDWFSERDIQVMMWGDMFLAEGEATDATFAPSKEEAKTRRDMLPKDIFITDWHYDVVEPEEYTSIEIWKDAGFETAGASWDRPGNIQNLALACINADAEGLLQTTWAGFNFRIDGNQQAWHQYWAYIYAAYYAWSGDTTPHHDLPFTARDVFLDVWTGRKPILEEKKGFLVDMTPFMNRKLADTKGHDGWLGYGPGLDMSSFPMDQEVFGETRFQVRENGEGEAALLLAGKFNPEGRFPESVRVDLEQPRRASELHFLSAAAFRAGEKTRAGTIKIVYTDGKSEEEPLIHGENLFAYTDNRVGPDARIAWEGTTESGKAVKMWDLSWRNPRPKKKIAAIELHSANSEAAPIIMAITGVE